MSDENQNEPIEVDEAVDVPVETVEDSHEWDAETEDEPKPKAKPKTTSLRVLLNSPFGRRGDIVVLAANDPRIKRSIARGVVEKA